ncbi:MAG TPA: hypothetical protein VGF52_06710, partial [Tepidisphaeraceae bacterium]
MENRRLLTADVTALPIGNALFFSTQTQSGQWQLMQSTLDGMQPQALASFVSQPDWFTNDNGTLIFSADKDDTTSGKELWKSDGTANGTTLVANIYPGAQGSNPNDFMIVDGNVVFLATDTTLNQSLFTTDGTADGTVPLIPLDSFHTSPTNITVQNNLLNFQEFVQSSGETQRYQSDGTVAGTAASPGGLVVNDTLGIFGTDGDDDIEISGNASSTTLTINGAAAQTFDNSDFSSIVVSALGGNDTVNVGDDVLAPANIDAGAGDDSVQAGGGNTHITGDDGNDTLSGGGGNDVINGDAGSDSLAGGAGNDSIGDTSSDPTDVNTLSGGDGNDTLQASFGDSTLSGGAGNDHLIAGFDSGHYDGGTGADTLDFFSNFAITKNADAQTITTTIGPPDDLIVATHSYVSIEKLIGSSNNDVIKLSPRDSIRIVEGVGGDDSIVGSHGNDLLIGGDGNDTLNGGPGADTLEGDGGTDSIISTSQDKVIGETVGSTPPPNGGILRVSGTSGDDQITVSLEQGDATMLQVSVNDVVNTYALSDVSLIQITAGDGNDNVKFDETNGAISLASKIYGGNGDDTLVGGSGRDRIYGG